MKKFLQITALTVALSSLALSSAPAQAKKAQANQQHTQASSQAKISKADAQRLVEQRNPGSNVVNSVEQTVNGHKVWALSVTTTGGNVTRKIFVDEETGKLSY